MKCTALITSFILITQLLSAQIKGDKTLITKDFPVEDITSVYVGLYADVLIDCSAQAHLQI